MHNNLNETPLTPITKVINYIDLHRTSLCINENFEILTPRKEYFLSWLFLATQSKGVADKFIPSYLKTGIENPLKHYSLTGEFSKKGLEENLQKVIFKRDRINIQRYLERYFRLDSTALLLFLKKIFLLDIDCFDLILTVEALENLALTDRELVIPVLSYLSTIIASRHINLSRFSSSPLTSEEKLLRLELEIKPICEVSTQLELKHACYFKSLKAIKMCEPQLQNYALSMLLASLKSNDSREGLTKEESELIKQL